MEEQHGDSSFDSNVGGEDAEMYLLKWNAHQNHFASKFSELLDEDDISFADVTLACEGNFLQAHRLVLSVCSPYFKNLFKVNCAEKGPATILIANVRYTDLENILHFMYRGQVNVRKEDLNKFLETGEQLQIDGLMGQNTGNGKQANPAKRRFSEGGQVTTGVRSAAQQIMTNRNGQRSLSQKQQYNIVNNPGGSATSRLVSAGTNSHQTNHIDVKKARVSPAGTIMKQDTVAGVSTTVTRRPSTSSHVSNANSNNSPAQDAELDGNNGIKILSVTGGSSNAAGYEAQGNEVYEILDYDGDEGGELEMDESEMMGYGDDGDEAMYYYSQESSSPYQRSSTNSTQQRASVSNPQVTARYPSIIDGVHFDLISADEKRVAAQCKLCPGEKVIRGSGLTSSNFISHLRAFHKRELEEWREKRKNESRRRMGLENPTATATMNSLNALF